MTTIDILKTSAKELQQRADEHLQLMAAAMGQESIRLALDSCHLADCPHKRELKSILLETISALEETRKAFKSKQLEALRKKMIRVLAEGT